MIKLDVQKRLGDFTLDAQFDAPAGVTAILAALDREKPR